MSGRCVDVDLRQYRSVHQDRALRASQRILSVFEVTRRMRSINYDVPIEHILTAPLLSCPAQTSVREAARQMTAHDCSAIVVQDSGIAAGIWTERDALSAVANGCEPEFALGGIMSSPLITADASLTAGEVTARLGRSGVRHVVVVKNGMPVGVLSQSDLIVSPSIDFSHFLLRLKPIESLGVPSPLVARWDASVQEIAALMLSSGVDAVVVDYGDSPLGILTEPDIVASIAQDTHRGTVGDIASRPLETLAATESLYAAQQCILKGRTRHIGMLDREGRCSGLVGFADILQFVRTEYLEELRNVLLGRAETTAASPSSTDLADRVIESALEGIIVTGKNGIIERVNPAFTRITGFTQKEVVGRSPSLLSSGRQSAQFYRELWQSLTSAGQWQGEIWNRRKSGELYLEYLTIASIRDDDGNVLHYAGIFSDVTQRRQTEERLNYRATHDALTGLLNRSVLDERLKRAIAHAARTRKKVAVLYIDLDGFKLVNDTLGHLGGDEVLRAIAQRLTEQVRSSDTVARLGGDEFALVIEQVDEIRDVVRIAHSLLDVVAAPIDYKEHQACVTPSIGISVYPDDAADPRQLVSLADLAMYAAKNNGKNNFQLFNRNVESSALAQLQMLTDLRHALDHGQFCLYYQPQWKLAGNAIVGVEALLRWRHPERGIIEPPEFIALAEQSGLITPIGAWGLREACAQARRWLDSGLEFGRVCVNISARQCLAPGFLSDLDTALEDSHLPPERLQLEIVESVAMNEQAEIVGLLHELARRGICLAIDDFGTGYTSLAYLKDLPVSTLKIDRSFLQKTTANDGRAMNAAVIKAIVAMGHALEMNVVMEGVETQEQLEFLRTVGCPEIQGFLLGRPGPPEGMPLSEASSER
ncbi:EAL domain-containing protein [Trinickia sp.]|uniref:EAL domain-containing protein n=1 Tax=Trinickia sp. TaxID=2571163 RepID=UPI002D7ED520|nr:EAL domain-containing protein [Trinickia sp.]